MKPQLIRSGNQIERQTIVVFEEKLNIKLPESYCSFLVKSNGGRPVPETFISRDLNGVSIEIAVLFFYKMEESFDSLSLLSSYLTFANRIPDDLFPIANTGTGDQICIGIEGEHLGKIFIWLHEHECAEDEYPCYDNVDLVANSFEEFINGFSEA